jgi:hypothetical protein
MFGIQPIGFDEALRRAVSEDPELAVAGLQRGGRQL